MKRTIYVLLVLGLACISCNQEGIGGKASISGQVKHHSLIIPDAVVYIKYGATSFPGFDPDLYDDQTTASSTDASYSFTNLYKGDYYLYGTGYDPALMETVSGGFGVKIKKKKEDVVENVPVTE